MKEKLSVAPFPADSSVTCETGGAGAAFILGDLEDDRVSWPSDGEMTVLRVKARGQSILGDGGHLCWPTGPRVQRPIPTAGAAVNNCLPDATGSLVNLAAPDVDATPDGEAFLVPLTSWSAKSVNLSDTVPVPLPSPRMNPLQLPSVKDAEIETKTPKTESTQADFSRPVTPRPWFWNGFIKKLCCGGDTDSR